MVLDKNNVFVTNGSKKNDGELASTSFCAEFRCGSCGMGLGGSLPSSKNRFSTKSVEVEEPVGRNGGHQTYNLTGFDVLRLATGSQTVEKKRIASRKLSKRVPGLQDVKNRPKRTKIIKNRKNQILSDFWPYFSLYFSSWVAGMGR